MMFDAQCDLAALVYEPHQNPDIVLRAFANDLNAHGHRAVGLVQLGLHCVDSKLSALLVHSGEQVPLLQDLGSCTAGCRLDVSRLLEAGTRIANAIERFGTHLRITRLGSNRDAHEFLAMLGAD